MCTVSHTRYGVKRRLRRKSYDCDEIAVPQRFPCKHRKTPGQQIVIEGEQVTPRNLAIRTPFSLMITSKIPSKMNPLASTTLGGFRSVEIQASRELRRREHKRCPQRDLRASCLDPGFHGARLRREGAGFCRSARPALRVRLRVRRGCWAAAMGQRFPAGHVARALARQFRQAIDRDGGPIRGATALRLGKSELFAILFDFAHDLVRKVCNFSGSCARCSIGMKTAMSANTRAAIPNHMPPISP
jgi:hypothetical protein